MNLQRNNFFLKFHNVTLSVIGHQRIYYFNTCDEIVFYDMSLKKNFFEDIIK